MRLLFDVDAQTLRRTDKNSPATDSVDYLTAKFNFLSAEWNGIEKVALFKAGDVLKEARLNSSGECVVPWEVLVKDTSTIGRVYGDNNYLYVSVVGINGSVKIPTGTVRVVLNESVYGEGTESEDPTPDLYAQFVADVKGYADSVETTAGEIKNLYSNALKGTVNGEVVRVDDVSPVEHNLKVNVHGKNLFDISKFEVTENVNTDYPYITSVGNDYIDITVDENYNGNGHIAFSLKLKDVCPQLIPGRTYCLSGISNAWNKCIYLKQLDYFWNFGTPLTITNEMLESTLGLYGYATYRGQDAGTCRLSNLQIEASDVATEYTPYIDPSTVSVALSGKNLFKVETITQTSNGVTFTKNSDGSITANGTAETTIYLWLGALKLNAGKQYRLSGSPTGSSHNTYMLYVNNTSDGTKYDLGQGVRFTGSDGTMDIHISISANTKVNNLTFRPMVVYGDEVSEFESYTGASYVPNADGSVDITSLSPTMTLLTYTEGVNIECEYNRDINVVIADIYNKLNG